MKRQLLIALLWTGAAAYLVSGQPQALSVKWEELTAADFQQAIQKAQSTCVLPFGIVEKHGPQLPLGTDLINVRYVAERGAAQEYAVVFPAYYFGQIFEARHEPGTLAYSAKLQLELLQETADEMARNGCKKIVIVNGHGGNSHLLPFFAQSQLAAPRDYVVYIMDRGAYPPGRPPLKSKVDQHAGESETAHTLISRPDLVHMDRAGQESGADRNRLDLPRGVYTGIWWYAKFPDHYAGDGSAATTELGEFDMKAWTASVADTIRAVKADQMGPRLQREFFDGSRQPLNTKQ
ncbi:MAG TPA: creatininase family protein [Candidatus Acidoferrales bacterium]|jgi:creatinine amidohydrolase|nr:creatininase family protein [Candidatus Acidoferrales bacterium]